MSDSSNPLDKMSAQERDMLTSLAEKLKDPGMVEALVDVASRAKERRERPIPDRAAIVRKNPDWTREMAVLNGARNVLFGEERALADLDARLQNILAGRLTASDRLAKAKANYEHILKQHFDGVDPFEEGDA